MTFLLFCHCSQPGKHCAAARSTRSCSSTSQSQWWPPQNFSLLHLLHEQTAASKYCYQLVCSYQLEEKFVPSELQSELIKIYDFKPEDIHVSRRRTGTEDTLATTTFIWRRTDQQPQNKSQPQHSFGGGGISNHKTKLATTKQNSYRHPDSCQND